MWALRMLNIGAESWEFGGELWNAVFGGGRDGDTLKETANIVAVRESWETKSSSFFIFPKKALGVIRLSRGRYGGECRFQAVDPVVGRPELNNALLLPVYREREVSKWTTPAPGMTATTERLAGKMQGSRTRRLLPGLGVQGDFLAEVASLGP